MIGAVVLTPILPAGLGLLPLAGVIGWGALGAWQQARTINRFLRNSRAAEAERSGTPLAYQLLASMASAQGPGAMAAVHQTKAPAATGEYDELVLRLKKLASIKASDVIGASEHRSRKIDVLSGVATGLDAGETETLLFALLPLLDAQVLSEEDLQFVKELGT